jgi:hypothetical protein
MLPTLYLGHVYTKGIIRTRYPRFLDGSKEESVDYNPESFGGQKLGVSTRVSTCTFRKAYLRKLSGKFPTFLANISHTCCVGLFHVDFLSTKKCCGW